MSLQMEANNDNSKNAKATLNIPFQTAEHAKIALRVLSVDAEPRRNFVQKELDLNDNQLIVNFTADQPKNLRTAVNGFFESLLLCADTLRELAQFEITSPVATTEAETTTTTATAVNVVENAGTFSSTNAA